MSVPQPLLEAGLSVEYQEDGARLIVRDADPGACAIRSRGGEAVARLLKENPGIRALDVRESNITDNGVGQISLALRLTNQLEELSLGVVGHAGLQWILGVVQRCSRLRSLRFEVSDVATLHAGRQTIEVSDFDTSGYVPPPPGEDEEEEAEEGEEEEAEEEADEDEGEDEEEAARKKAARLAAKVRARFADNGADSGDEGGLAQAQGAASAEPAGASQKLLRLLSDFVACARASEGLRSVECVGEAIPAELMLDLDRALQEHRDAAERKGSESEEGANTNMHACLGGKKEALLSDLLQIAAWAQRAPAEEEGVEDAAESPESRKTHTRLGLRHYLGQTLVAPLGEALFECQRFKSKDNEAVATANGEIAFVAMALRKHAQASQRGTGRVP